MNDGKNHLKKADTMSKTKPFKGYLYKRKSVWWLQYVEPNQEGKKVRFRHSLETTDKKEAEQKAERITSHLFVNDFIERERIKGQKLETALDAVKKYEAAKNRMALADVWDRHPYDHSVRGGTVKMLKLATVTDNRQVWTLFVKWAANRQSPIVMVDEVTAEIAAEYSVHCRKILEPRTHNKRIEMCRVMFNLAGVDPNPFGKIKEIKEDNEHRDRLTQEEIDRALAAASGEMRVLLEVALETGMRMGDCATLCWENVQDGRIVKRTAKTGAPLSLKVSDYLAAALATMPKAARGPVMPEMDRLYRKDPATMSLRVRRLFESVGIETREKVNGRKRAVSKKGFHALRVTFITTCAKAGVPIGAIATWCGHSPEVNRVYQDWKGNETDDRITGAISSARNKTAPMIGERHSTVIDAEFREITSAKADLLALVEKMDETTAAAWLAKMQS